MPIIKKLHEKVFNKVHAKYFVTRKNIWLNFFAPLSKLLSFLSEDFHVQIGDPYCFFTRHLLSYNYSSLLFNVSERGGSSSYPCI
ncbi:MAG: hypothetical protein EA344_02565 [Alkalicoccus sp.]|nr:MAG: hypothetical protein EA344_02565 [Alkalicoccus sp.]